jgi:hypothetical protein
MVLAQLNLGRKVKTWSSSMQVRNHAPHLPHINGHGLKDRAKRLKYVDIKACLAKMQLRKLRVLLIIPKQSALLIQTAFTGSNICAS